MATRISTPTATIQTSRSLLLRTRRAAQGSARKTTPAVTPSATSQGIGRWTRLASYAKRRDSASSTSCAASSATPTQIHTARGANPAARALAANPVFRGRGASVRLPGLPVG